MKEIIQFYKPFQSYKYLLGQLVVREIKSRYKQSFVGYAWIVLNPLSQLVVYSFVFSIIFKTPTYSIPYPIFIFAALIPWIYLQTTLTASTLSLVDNSNLLRKINFPRELLPYSVVLSKLVDFCFSLILLFIFMLFVSIPFTRTILFLIPVIFVQIVLMTALSLLFSSFNLFYRDFQYLINLLLLLWMYMTPIIYPITLVPNKFLWLYYLNPMTGIIEGYRFALFNTPYNPQLFYFSAISSLALFIIAYTIFKKMEKSFADIV